MQVLPRIQRKSLRDRAADLIQQAIAAGIYPPGSSIPTEESPRRELGVSRSSVRDALEHLVALGLDERQTGRPMYVTQPQDCPERAIDNLVPAMPLSIRCSCAIWR